MYFVGAYNYYKAPKKEIYALLLAIFIANLKALAFKIAWICSKF